MEDQSKNTFKPFISLILATKIPKLAFTIGIIGSLITTLVGLSIPLLTREMVDGFSVEAMSITLIVIIVVVFIVRAALDAMSRYLLAYVGQNIVARLRERMLLKVIRLPVSYFDRKTSGESVSRIVNDTGVVKDLISQHFPQFITGIISIIGAVIILIIMDWKMTVLMLTVVPVTIFIMRPLGKKMRKISHGLQDETAQFSGKITQTISEVRLMKASNAEKAEEQKGTEGISNLLAYGLKESRILALIGPLMQLVIMGILVVIIGYGGIRVAEGTMTTGSLVAFILYLFQIIMPLTVFTMFFTQLQKAKGATERMIEILELEEEQGPDGIEMEITNQPVRFENVFFSYNEEESVLQNVSFEVQPGTMVAFAGPSGGGKTTVFGLLERFYEPQEGRILIGNAPINEISLASWRSQIGYVSQDSPMVAGTIRENLTYGIETDIDDERLWGVAKMAYAEQFIQQFPNGLDTEVGERGIKLSGGQRQRIAIARAFLRDPKILMMDEATASLDSQSEKIVQQALTRLMEGRTTFVIAHRLSTIVNADKIIFIEKGEITGVGTHKELVNGHALYREFAEQQLT
ncbi:multidrug ABC transporter permease [Anaerobacillus arseniciselenatis]|uniref:Multidrug ABC transporter permease n=1 Tax=Anaerobacillus arseniciselenatis TaxID=85682 RepID=A0A1S2LQZ7_9BACI|nr:ABC transporter ATP-binding protein [Anaerobacillus arseniciselenatis]OIJ14543.1 multidrug ABC transporter permease [Anaerobacillus arseniciselenatis]